MQVAPIVPIVISASRMPSKCCLKRCLSALLSADVAIRLFSSARTRSLTLLRVATSSAATGIVVVVVPPVPVVVVSPTSFEYSVYGFTSAARTWPAPAALERDPFGDVALRARVQRQRIAGVAFTALAITMSAEMPPE